MVASTAGFICLGELQAYNIFTGDTWNQGLVTTAKLSQLVLPSQNTMQVFFLYSIIIHTGNYQLD